VTRLYAAIALAALACAARAQTPTFYRDVLPILQNRCQECHRPGEMAPMALRTYAETRPWARAIREQVATGKMPPWFADPCCGRFSNDRTLTAAEHDTLLKWASSSAPAGKPHDAPPPRDWPDGWNLPSPDLVLAMPKPFSVPATGAVEYQYFGIPTGFTEDRWVSGVEVKPGYRAVVHHIVVYVREPGQTWTQAPTKSDILGLYTPGASADILPEGMARLVKAGSELVFEIHYTPKGKRVLDQSRIALTFFKPPPGDVLPQKRVLTLEMDNVTFRIPAGERDYPVSVWGTLPNDALLLSLLPHMHLRGKAFEYTLIHDNGQPEVLLRVPNYNFYWQLSYRLATPLPLKKGTKLAWMAHYDNSKRNPRNPDPTVDVGYGHQSWDEMMVGFFDVAVDPHLDKHTFFMR
jgi:hypothetical protein